MSISSLIYELFKIIDIYGILILGFLIINYIVISISLYCIYDKIGKNKKAALIPIYNLISLLDLVSLPKILVVLLIVPYVNILGMIIMNFIISTRIVKVFKQDLIMKMGLMFVPIIFFPLLSKKNLVYSKIINKEPVKKIVEKPKEVELDLPTYDIDLSHVNVGVLSANEIKNINKNNVESKVTDNIDDVADLTFDYNKLYNIKEIEGVNNMNQENNNEVITPVPIELNIDFLNENNSEIPSAPMEPVMETLVAPSISEVMPELEIPSAPMEPVVGNPVAPSIPEVMPELEIPSAPVAPVVETEVAPSIPEVMPELEIPSAPMEPVMETEVAPSISEVMPELEIPSAPMEPVVGNPVAPSIPEVMPELEIPSAPMEPVMETPVAPSIPEVMPKLEIPSAPVAPVVETPVAPSIPVKIEPTTEAVDYNSLYNIQKEEDVTQKYEEQKEELKNQTYDSLNMAAPPSFEIPIKIEEDETIEEQAVFIPEIKKEDLVSVSIDEPEALPVRNLNLTKEIDKPMDINNLIGVDNLVSNNDLSINTNVSDLPPGYSVSGNPAFVPPQSQRNLGVQQPMIQQQDGYPGINMQPQMTNQMPVNQVYPEVNMQPQMTNQMPVNQGYPEVNMQPQINQVMPSNMASNNGFQNINNSGLLRENEDTRSLESSMRGPSSTRFITNDDSRYTLPKEEKPVVQMPTDPNLLANPMAIFGSSANVIRPTSAEAMRENVQQPMMNQGMNNQQMMTNKCPNCGFVVKEGQPTCVVCGARLI